MHCRMSKADLVGPKLPIICGVAPAVTRVLLVMSVMTCLANMTALVSQDIEEKYTDL